MRVGGRDVVAWTCVDIFFFFFSFLFFFFFNDTATTEIYTLSLHDALPICLAGAGLHLDIQIDAAHLAGHQRIRDGKILLALYCLDVLQQLAWGNGEIRISETLHRSEEHTSELQSH